MKLILQIIICLLLPAGSILAQEVETSIDSSRLSPEITPEFLNQKKLNVNVEFGSYFSTSKGLGSGFGTYVAPQLRYRFNPRFSLSTGIQVFQTQGIFGLENTPYYQPTPFTGQSYGSLLFVSGDYRLTDKLVVSGTAYKQVDLFRLNPSSQPSMNYDYHGIIMGVDYQLGEHFFIHGEVEFSNGYNSFGGQSPFMHNQFNNSFRNSSFQH